MVRKLLPLAGGLVAAAAFSSSGLAADTAPKPVPSLTPAKTQKLWRQLVRQPRARSFDSAACVPLRAVFYAGTDWLRLATKLAANPAPCAQYYISVPPLVADKTQFRADQAWRIRALGPQFHALAEVNITGWSSWVSTNGTTWTAAGQEARRRMAAAGYDVSAGDTWVVNEFSSAVRQGVGSARPNMRAFVRALYEGDGTLPAARGAVFITGMSQGTVELSVYQSRLQDWYEDASFWNDMRAYVSDWSQELYGDVRTWAVPGADRATRAASLNEYLQHQISLARVAPASAGPAASYLATAYNPLGNAAWAYDAAFGWTNVPYDLMQSYVSSQVDALRSFDGSRFGFAWAPKNLNTLAAADFTAQTDAILVRLAAAIAEADPCATSWCGGDLAGAAFTTGWRTFATWKPSALAFGSAPQTIEAGIASGALTVELRTNTGVAYSAGLPVPVTFSSSSPTGAFATSATGPWTSTLTAPIASGSTTVSVYYRDTQTGSPTVVGSTGGKVAAAQPVTVTDTVAPDTQFTSWSRADSRSATFWFTANEPASFECSLDSGAWIACASPKTYTALAKGWHTVRARAIDTAGNVDASPAAHSFKI